MSQAKPTHLVLIGAGKWGMALANTFLDRGLQFITLGKDDDDKWDDALQNKPLCLLAPPFKTLSKILDRLSNYDLYGVINASKGIDRESLKTFSGIAKDKLKTPFATLSGPTFAKELSDKLPAACVLAGEDQNFINTLRDALSTDYFRIYSSQDIVGTEVCGAIKNALAIACGICDGLKLGDNASAALLTRGLHEAKVLLEYFGGQPDTVYGLAGIGDILLTAKGDLSRNRNLGLQIAKGLHIDNALTQLSDLAEGYYTVNQIHRIALNQKLDLPICQQVYEICYLDKNPKEAILKLMTRTLKSES